MTPAHYAVLLLVLLITAVAIPILLRAQGKIFGLPPSWWAGFMLVGAVAGIVWLVRRIYG